MRHMTALIPIAVTLASFALAHWSTKANGHPFVFAGVEPAVFMIAYGAAATVSAVAWGIWVL